MVRDAAELACAGHEHYDGGLNASAQADDCQRIEARVSAFRFGPSSGAESVRGGSCQSLVTHVTSRVNRRRSRSGASGPGFKSMATTLMSD